MNKHTGFDPILERNIIITSKRKLLGSVILQWEIEPFILMPKELVINVPPFCITPEDTCEMTISRNSSGITLELRPIETKNLIYTSYKFTGSDGIIVSRKNFIVSERISFNTTEAWIEQVLDRHLIDRVECECVIKAYEHFHHSNIVSDCELNNPNSDLVSAKTLTNGSKQCPPKMNESCPITDEAESFQTWLDILKHLNNFFSQEQYHLSSNLKKLFEDLFHLNEAFTVDEQANIINKSDTLKKLGRLLKELCEFCTTKEQYQKFSHSNAYVKQLDNLVQLCNLLEADEEYIAARASIIKNKLIFDLKRAYHHGLHTDINLIVGNDSIAAHKVILCSRSPIFAAMFEHETLEKTRNVIEMKDMEFDALKNFVSFLYTSELDVDDFNTLCNLYYAADKYGVFDLRLKCREMIVSIMNTENACRTLALGDHHNDIFLKSKAIEFIKFHLKDVVQTNGWIKFMDIKLSAEVFMTKKPII